VPFGPAKLLKALSKRREASLGFRVVLGVANQHSNPLRLGRLRRRADGPRGRSGAEKRDELAPPHLPPHVCLP